MCGNVLAMPSYTTLRKMNLAVLSLPEVHSSGRSTDVCNAALMNKKVTRTVLAEKGRVHVGE